MAEMSGRVKALRRKLGLEVLDEVIENAPETEIKAVQESQDYNNMPRPLSKRLIVLLHIYDYQVEHGHGIGFTELKERTGLPHGTVSKSHDSLSDIGLVTDTLIKEGEAWTKVIQIDDMSMCITRRIKQELNYWKFIEANERMHRRGGK